MKTKTKPVKVINDSKKAKPSTIPVRPKPPKTK